MANIVKLQDDLKGIPLKNLIMYVQNPNGQVPSYLALAEIKRRKDMEQRAMAEQNAPSHLSVAEELTAPRQNIGPQFDTPQTMMAAQKQGITSIPPQQMAQGGIADLDPGNMYDDKNYAAGGIIAFEGGGDVASTDAAPGSDLPSDAYMSDIQRSLLGSSPVHYTGATAGPAFAYSSPYGSDMIGEMMRVSPEALRYSYGVGRGTSPYAGAAYSAMRKEMRSPGYAEGGEVQHFQEGGSSRLGDWFSNLRAQNLEKQEQNKRLNQLLSEKYRIQSDIFRSRTPEQKTAQDEALKQIDSMIAEEKTKRAGVDMKAPTTIPGANVMGSQAAADRTTSTYYDPSQNIGYKGAPYKEAPKGDESGIYDQEKVRTIGDYAKELQDYLGPDKNVALQRERLAKLEGRASKMEEQAPWLALTEAGFGAMAGTSPYALTNLGAGAQMGLKSYAAAQDKFANLEEKRLNLLMNIDQAERREKVAVGEFGAKSKQAAEERNFKRKLQKDLLDVKMAMNTDDNMKALMAAEIRNKPDITQTLKLNEFVESRLPQEKNLILEDLGGNADKPGSKNYSKYLERMEQAKVKLATQGRTIPGMAPVSGVPVTGKQVKFLGFE